MARGQRSENDPNRKVDRDAVMRSLVGQMMGTEKTSSQKKEEAFKGLVDDIMGMHKGVYEPVVRENKISDISFSGITNVLRTDVPKLSSQEYGKKKS